MTDVNALRCTASQIIINIMESDAPAEERAQQLHMLWTHASAAHKQVTGEEPKVPEVSEETRRQMIASMDEYDRPHWPVPEKLVRGNVVFDQCDSKKKVICKDQDNTEGWQLVCENPHEDGDFSYLCFHQHCRCLS